MQTNSNNDWRASCDNLGLDHQQLKAVSQRYDMYSSFTDEQGGDKLPLKRWYKWYRVEKLSEGHAMQTPPDQACSVGPDVHQSGSVVSEQDFLQLLQSYRTSRGQTI
jgi:hypothetical protein